MPHIHETRLPGVGIRHDFETGEGDRIGIIHHHSGRRDLLIYDPDDPDSVQTAIQLNEDDARSLAEILGVSPVTRELLHLQQSIGGLTIDWIPIKAEWSCVGSTIAQIGVRNRTGVTIVAVVREQQTIPSPTPDFQLLAGDIAVVIGLPEHIQKAFAVLQNNT